MTGHFYIIQLAPDVCPQRLKMGWALDPKRRISMHRIAAPSARLLGAWPCDREKERPTIRILSRSDCCAVAASKEVFDCENVPAMVARAERFFLEPDWTSDPVTQGLKDDRPPAITPDELKQRRLQLGLTQAELAPSSRSRTLP
jgi:hypothetical protein